MKEKFQKKIFKNKRIKIIYKLKIEFKNDCYYYKLINKDFIINNLKFYSKEEINNYLNYINNNHEISIKNNKILLSIY